MRACNIVILPPDEVGDILKLSPESMLRLRKAVHGLMNAPKRWRDRLERSFLNHGFTSCASDPCAFVLKTNQKCHQCSCGLRAGVCWLSCHSVTVQRTALPANVHLSWYLLVTVSTSLERDFGYAPSGVSVHERAK